MGLGMGVCRIAGALLLPVQGEDWVEGCGGLLMPGHERRRSDRRADNGERAGGGAEERRVGEGEMLIIIIRIQIVLYE